MNTTILQANGIDVEIHTTKLHKGTISSYVPVTRECGKNLFGYCNQNIIPFSET